MKRTSVSLFIVLCCAVLGFSQETFSDKRFGFSMQTPKGWIAMTKSDQKENLGRMEVSDEALEQILRSGKGATFLGGFYKYDPQTTPGLIPSIQIEARTKGPMDFAAFKTQLVKSTASLKTVFPDIVFENVQEVEISGIHSLLLVGKFTMKTADDQVLRARSRIYAIPLKNYFLQATFNDGQDAAGDCSAEFSELTKTIRIGR
jgi:hypothetical protein